MIPSMSDQLILFDCLFVCSKVRNKIMALYSSFFITGIQMDFVYKNDHRNHCLIIRRDGDRNKKILTNSIITRKMQIDER